MTALPSIKGRLKNRIPIIKCEEIHGLVEQFFANRLKRTCMPEGPKIVSVSLSSRKDRRMPTEYVATWRLEELEASCLKAGEVEASRAEWQ